MSGKKPWSGRFKDKTAGPVEEFTQSVSYDRELYAQDIAGSLAHARMLAGQGIISARDLEAIEDGLSRIRQEIESGEFAWRFELEDVHMNIETRLIELVGDPGRRLHTGRSRNDQVALDFRLFTAGRLEEWRKGLTGLIRSLLGQAEAEQGVLLPGCTHLQPAQPVALSHHLLAYAWMLVRDFERIGDCLARVRVSPLGAAALAGTTYDLDPVRSASELGLDAVFQNSMDAVSDRDFTAESLFCGCLVMAHLSRLCEDLIIWANPNFGYLILPDAYATGSSIMPQKKNPDTAELTRGKTGRVYGALISILTTLKGLPMTYNRDLQEDKEPFLDASRTIESSLGVMSGLVAALGFNRERMRQAMRAGFLNATELADYLAAKGAPFREAHHVAGAAVALAESKGVGLEDLSLDELKGFSALIEGDVFEHLSYEAAASRRETRGGTGPGQVKRQIDELRSWLARAEK